MKLILTVDPIRPVLTGIGRYTWELAIRIPRDARVEECRFFARGAWIQDCAVLLQDSLLDRLRGANGSLLSRLVRRLYRIVSPVIQGLSLWPYRGSLFHSTNFYLPPFSGKAIVTVHDLSALKFPEFHPPERVAHLKKEIPRVIRKAKHIITDSEFTRREVMDLFGLPAAKVTTVVLGVTEEYRPRASNVCANALSRYGVQYGTYCLCVATIEPRKNIEGLLADRLLAPTLRARHPLLIIGHQGWNSVGIHGLIQQAVDEGWCRYAGYVDEADLPAIFSAARLFAFPSWYEGFGLPVLQAMASGVPCVASNASSVPEVAGDAALLVDPSDSMGWGAGLSRGLSDEKWRETAIKRGLARAGTMDWNACAKNTIDVYEKVLGES